MRAQCFSSPVQRRYYASSGSLPHIVSVALLLAAVFVPLFLAHGSRGFWPTTSTYTEQPHVKLTYQVIAVLEGQRVDASGARQYLRLIPNSLPSRVQRLLEGEMRSAQIKASESAYEIDSNRDGSPESLHVHVMTPLQPSETIHQLQALVFLNYTLNSHVKLNMDALAAVSHTSHLPAMSFSADGDLRLVMRSPARVVRDTQTPFVTSPLLNTSRILGARDLDMGAIVSKYRARDWQTHLDVPYPLWTTDAAPGASAATQRRSFQLDLTIRIPPITVLYRPTWSELLKTAWIQYFSLAAIVYALVHAVLGVLFKNRILDTYTILDDPLVLTKKHH